MTPSNYPGIDYSHGTSNIDHETGIRYGVISQHSLDPEVLNDLEADYGEPHCPKCGKELEIDCLYCPVCEEEFDSQDCYPEEPVGLSYSDDTVQVTQCLDTDLFVVKSKYYTHAQFCSPCVPGAGNLDTPCPTGPKTYCLGPEWFENDQAPYPVYEVESNKLIP